MEKIQNPQTVAQNTAVKPVADKASTPEFRQKKAEAAKRFSERQKERKAALAKAAKEIVENKMFNTLSKEAQDFLNDVLNPVKASGFGGQSFFNKVFGDNPKVGDKITVMEYMSRTFQAKKKLDNSLKDWAEKGIIVEFKEDKADGTKSTYTITKM